MSSPTAITPQKAKTLARSRKSNVEIRGISNFGITSLVRGYAKRADC